MDDVAPPRVWLAASGRTGGALAAQPDLQRQRWGCARPVRRPCPPSALSAPNPALLPGSSAARPGDGRPGTAAPPDPNTRCTPHTPQASNMVRPGDASMAAPFTAKQSSVMPCLDILKQGRCTLVSARGMRRTGPGWRRRALTCRGVLGQGRCALVSAPGAGAGRRHGAACLAGQPAVPVGPAKLTRFAARPLLAPPPLPPQVTTVQMFKVLGLLCLSTAYSLSVLYMDGIKLGDLQARGAASRLPACSVRPRCAAVSGSAWTASGRGTCSGPLGGASLCSDLPCSAPLGWGAGRPQVGSRHAAERERREGRRAGASLSRCSRAAPPWCRPPWRACSPRACSSSSPTRAPWSA